MGLVDNIDLKLPVGRSQSDLLTKVADIIDPPVGSGINLNQINKSSLLNLGAEPTLSAGLSIF